MALTDLPDPILEKVFSRIDVFGREVDRLSFSLVCQKFRDIEPQRTVLELEGLGANPVEALALYPNLTALKADKHTCSRWFAGRFGKTHTSQHSFRVLDLDCSTVFGRRGLHPLFHDLMPGVPKKVQDSWRPKGAPCGLQGTLEELVIRGRDSLDLTCVRDEFTDWGSEALMPSLLRKLILEGNIKNTYHDILGPLGPNLVSLDVSGLQRGRRR